MTFLVSNTESISPSYFSTCKSLSFPPDINFPTINSPGTTETLIMSPRNLDSRYAIDSCTFQLHSWRPFNYNSPKPYPTSSTNNGAQSKRPCPNDRATTSSFPIDTSAIDMSKLSLFDDDHRSAHNKRESLGLMARKRRRKGSRSVSGRSSDRSGTRRRCCSVGASAAYATCSDFPVAAGTDSSGEMFVSGDANWASDASEAAMAARNSRRERERDAGNGGGDKENSGIGFGGVLDNQGNESGYGSEPGYRGDAELGYDDEIDEEEDDPRLLFWGEHFGDRDSYMEIIGENTLQKAHHRCRRKKQDLRMVVDPLR